MDIVKKSPNDLVPYEKNARTHSEKHVEQIEKSIREFGFTNPVLIYSENVILAGHGRVLAAKNMGLDAVPTICIDNLTEAQRRAYILADNRIALNAGWDPELLKIELGALIDENFDLSLTGFDDFEIDELFMVEVNDKAENDTTVFEQSIQLEPAKEYILVVCDDQEDFDTLRAKLNLGMVRRGGYKKGSAFDAVGSQRIITAKELFGRLTDVDSNSE